MSKKEDVAEGQKEYKITLNETEIVARVQEIEANEDFQLFLRVSHGARLNEERIQFHELMQPK